MRYELVPGGDVLFEWLRSVRLNEELMYSERDQNLPMELFWRRSRREYNGLSQSFGEKKLLTALDTGLGAIGDKENGRNSVKHGVPMTKQTQTHSTTLNRPYTPSGVGENVQKGSNWGLFYS